MWKISAVLVSALLVTACSPGLAPNGMTWEEYRSAEYRFKVIHQEEALSGCVELGFVRGKSWDGVAESKEDAIAAALLLRADSLIFDSLWSDWQPFRLFGRKELHYAEGRAYRCSDKK